MGAVTNVQYKRRTVWHKSIQTLSFLIFHTIIGKDKVTHTVLETIISPLLNHNKVKKAIRWYPPTPPTLSLSNAASS